MPQGWALALLLAVRSFSCGGAVGPRGGPSGAGINSFQAVLWVLTLQLLAPVVSGLLPSPGWASPRPICPRKGIRPRPRTCAPPWA